MTLHGDGVTIGVRELHDRLSEHLQRVQAGGEITITRRGRPTARLTAFDVDDPLEDLVRDGLVAAPRTQRRTEPPRVIADGTVSDLVADQRR